jgi:poly(A) polymerase
VLEKWNAYKAAGENPVPALHLAADDVLDGQTEQLAIQRRIATDMRDIWAMQPRFERRVGKSPFKLLEHPRLRAGYDFLLLRCASGEIDDELGEWWTDFMGADGAGREALLSKKPVEADAPAAKRRRRRGGRGRGKPDAESAPE